MIENEKYNVSGMTCASCVSHVDKAVRKVEGVKDVSVNLLTNSMTVTYDENITDHKKISRAVSNAGYKAKLKDSVDEKVEEDELKSMKFRLFSSLILLIPLFYIGMGYMLNMEYGTIFPLGAFGENEFFVGLTEMSLSLIIMIINKKFFISGSKALIHKNPNMDTLVALGSSIAFIYSFIMMFVMAFYAKNNQWDNVMKASMNLSFETSGMVPTLITIGKTLETYSKGKTTNAIKGLLSLQNKTIHIKTIDGIKDFDVSEAKLNDTFIVYPGESFPVDGEVIEGESAVDESALTGESLPVDKTIGSKVSTATINQNGALTCVATRIGEDTTLSKIVKMVEEASSTKTHISQLADKVAGVFVPIVLLIALMTFLGWIIFGREYVNTSLNMTTPLTYSLERAISVLVISCPCSLGLATPLAIMVGNGLGAKNGILFKNATALENAGKVEYVVLDKTGTITKGKPFVKDILSYIDENEFLKIAGSLESKSEHPLSLAIKEEIKKRDIQIVECDNFKAILGSGVTGYIDKKKYYAGNNRLMESLNLMNDEMKEKEKSYSKEGKTILFFATEERIIGIITVADTIKEDSKYAIDEFKKLGITTIMLTGDNYDSAKTIASQVGIDHVIAHVLPEEKKEVIDRLKHYGKTMMIGDGINDAPSLTSADIAIAIGAGSDIAIDSADIILTSSSLNDAVKAIRLSKITLRNIIENLFWAFFYNIIMIPIAAGCFSALGLNKLRPWMGAFAMACSSLCVVLNALRLNLYDLNKSRFHKNYVKELPNFEEKSHIEIEIEGMMCDNCVKHVKEALETIDAIEYAIVSLENKKAKVYLKEEVDDKLLRQVIKEAGYKVKRISYN